LVGDRVRIERGSFEVTAPRAAVVAHWSPVSRVSRSVSALACELQSRGYRVIVSSSCEAHGELGWDGTVDLDELVVLRKPNVGYDFGSWSVALALAPWIADAERVILANDSMSGPFRPLGPLLDEFDRKGADVWGLTDSLEFAPHLQSYFLGFRDGVLADKPLAAFWARIRDYRDKQQTIFRNELGLSRLLREEGYTRHAAFPHEWTVRSGVNPVIVGWRRMLELGFPFLKREILRDPAVAPEGTTAPVVLERLLDIDVTEWVDAGDLASG